MALARLQRPASLSDMAYRELRGAIVDGRLKLGDQVSELSLSRMLGISKTPVREALLRLLREGLVEIDPRRGTSIFQIDDAEVDAIASFRLLLEDAAARAGFAGDRAQFAAGLRHTVSEMRAALEEGDRLSYRRLDARFHEIIVAASGNPYVVAAYDTIAAKIGALRTRAQDADDVVRQSLRMHAALLAHLEAGDADSFCTLLARHIANTGRDYRAWLGARARERRADCGDALQQQAEV